jgi:hypothetical protein
MFLARNETIAQLARAELELVHAARTHLTELKRKVTNTTVLVGTVTLVGWGLDLVGNAAEDRSVVLSIIGLLLSLAVPACGCIGVRQAPNSTLILGCFGCGSASFALLHVFSVTLLFMRVLANTNAGTYCETKGDGSVECANGIVTTQDKTGADVGTGVNPGNGDGDSAFWNEELVVEVVNNTLSGINSTLAVAAEAVSGGSRSGAGAPAASSSSLGDGSAVGSSVGEEGEQVFLSTIVFHVICSVMVSRLEA